MVEAVDNFRADSCAQTMLVVGMLMPMSLDSFSVLSERPPAAVATAAWVKIAAHEASLKPHTWLRSNGTSSMFGGVVLMYAVFPSCVASQNGNSRYVSHTSLPPNCVVPRNGQFGLYKFFMLHGSLGRPFWICPHMLYNQSMGLGWIGSSPSHDKECKVASSLLAGRGPSLSRRTSTETKDS